MPTATTAPLSPTRLAFCPSQGTVPRIAELGECSPRGAQCTAGPEEASPSPPPPPPRSPASTKGLTASSAGNVTIAEAIARADQAPRGRAAAAGRLLLTRTQPFKMHIIRRGASAAVDSGALARRFIVRDVSSHECARSRCEGEGVAPPALSLSGAAAGLSWPRLFVNLSEAGY